MGRAVIEMMFASADTQLTWVLIDADAAYPYAGARQLSGAYAMTTTADAWTDEYTDQPEFADVWANGYGTAVRAECVDAWAKFVDAGERGDAR